MAAKTVSLADLLLAEPAPAGVRADIDLVARLQERSAGRLPWRSVKGWAEAADSVRERLEQAFPAGPADFLDLLSDGEGELLRVELDYWRMDVWKEGDGGALVNLDRLFLFRSGVVDMKTLKLRDAAQGAGKGVRILAGTVRAAKMLGMQRLDLKATNAGSYVWAKAGFLPDDDLNWQNFAVQVRRRLAEPEFAKLPAAERRRIAAVLGRPDRAAIWDLVDLDKKKIADPKAIYRLVYDIFWWGELHLDDAKQTARLREYAKSRGAAA